MEREGKGFEIYVEEMGKSTNDKIEKIAPLVRQNLESTKGDILDLGAGGGDLSKILFSFSQEFNVGMTILDIDPRMTEILKKKFNQPEVDIILGNVLNFRLDNSFSAAVCSSLLHEVFSKRESMDDIKQALKNIWHHLLPGGILIIRDGIKPSRSQERILLKPLDSEVLKRLEKFTASYKYIKDLPYLVEVNDQTLICLTREFAYEFAVKYQYPDINWQVEMEEQFGFWTEKEAREILKETGFKVTYLKKYLLSYFGRTFAQDFLLFKHKNNRLARVKYFDTHMVIAAKRS